MKKSLLRYLVCPNCRGSLELKEGYKSHGEEVNGGLLCCVLCESKFPILNDIPRFVSKDNYSNNFGFQWDIFRKTQLDSFSKTTISRQRFFRQCQWKSEEMQGALVIDVGCGAGRFTEIALKTGATIIAIDYSNAVEACWNNLKHNSNLHVIQADIYALPFKSNLFDYGYCFGVLQHVPDVKKAFVCLVDKIAVNGKICVDCYMKDWRVYCWVKYWLRPITKRMSAPLLLNIVTKIVPWFLPVGNLLIKIPVIGHYLRYALPVANYKGILPLNKQQLIEWSTLDTLDMYSPKYDNPQTLKTIKRWFEEAGLKENEILNQGLIVARGVKN